MKTSKVLENYSSISKKIPSGVTLVLISKTRPIEAIESLYQKGHRIFGENKVQEITQKYSQLPKDISWHMVGHLQRNKVKYIAPFVQLIQSVDSLKLLQEIDRQAKKHHRKIDCLLQIRIAKEYTKFGLDIAEAEVIIENNSLEHVQIRGLMGMATNTENTIVFRSEFMKLKVFFDKWSIAVPQFDTLSMGMSGDYDSAIACGSNMVRLGSTIFNTE